MHSNDRPGLIALDARHRTYGTTDPALRSATDPVYVLHLSPDEALTLARMLEIAYRADAVHATKGAARITKAAELMALDVLAHDRATRYGAAPAPTESSPRP